jgi:predicted dehydrogenase/threonine dehydrogenase-like Zn-dependent dehydrogenase
MKQLIQSYKTGGLELKEVPRPLCRQGGVLVHTHFSLISAGTEKLMIELAKKSLAGKARQRPDLVKKVLNKIRSEGIVPTVRKVFAKLDEPVALGYSCAGEVIEVGDGIDGITVGDEVACAGAGFASHSEINFVPNNLCVKVPADVDLQDASFTTIGAIAMQGIRRCELRAGENVAVIGLGLIGQLTVQILSAYGHPVLGIDIDRNKVERVRKLGLTKAALIGRDDVEQVAASFSGGYGVDAVIITASTKSSEPVELAGRICRRRGCVSAVGLVGMEIPRQIYYEKELDFRVSCSYGPGRYDVDYEEKGLDYPYEYVRWTERRNMEEFLRLISTGKIDVKSLVTHKFRIDDYDKAYDLILKNPQNEEYNAILFEYDNVDEHRPVLVINEHSKRRQKQNCVNVGVIGAGNFARSVTLPSLGKFANVNICAIADVNGSIAEKISRKYKCRYCTTDYHRILNDNEIDTVFVTTRHNLHAPIVTEALKNNKNVFVEKPLCITEQQLSESVSVYQSVQAEGAQPILMVGFNRRFAPKVVETKSKFVNRSSPLMINYRINAGYIPADHWVHDPQQGGGRIIGEVCHFVDLVQFLANSAPVKLYATSLSAAGKVLADDNVSILIDFADGSRAHILYTAMGDNTLGKEYIEIFSDGACFAIDDFKKSKFGSDQDKGHFEEVRLFVESILSGAASPIPVNEIMLSTLATIRINDSLRTGESARIELSQIADSQG